MNVDPNANYAMIQAWLAFLATLPIVNGIVGAAILWIFSQALDNKWAGGKLYERKNAWMSTTLAAVIVFLILVVPNVTLPVAIGVVATAGLILIAYLQKKHWKV